MALPEASQRQDSNGTSAQQVFEQHVQGVEADLNSNDPSRRFLPSKEDRSAAASGQAGMLHTRPPSHANLCAVWHACDVSVHSAVSVRVRQTCLQVAQLCGVGCADSHGKHASKPLGTSAACGVGKAVTCRLLQTSCCLPRRCRDSSCHAEDHIFTGDTATLSARSQRQTKQMRSQPLVANL